MHILHVVHAMPTWCVVQSSCGSCNPRFLLANEFSQASSFGNLLSWAVHCAHVWLRRCDTTAHVV